MLSVKQMCAVCFDEIASKSTFAALFWKMLCYHENRNERTKLSIYVPAASVNAMEFLEQEGYIVSHETLEYYHLRLKGIGETVICKYPRAHKEAKKMV